TVLLFFAIPAELQIESFDNGVLLFVIIATALVMTWAMIKADSKDLDDEVLEMLGKPQKDESEEDATDSDKPEQYIS
ncbi:sodium:proton exchanger, partial [Salibacteraceae bacterium]|nr:sodium:proton exchanger [Salibacteraceae bacterium]